MNNLLAKMFNEYARLRGGEFADPVGTKIAYQGFMVGAHALIGLIQRTPNHLFVQVMKEIQLEAEAELTLMNPKNTTPKIKSHINGEAI